VSETEDALKAVEAVLKEYPDLTVEDSYGNMQELALEVDFDPVSHDAARLFTSRLNTALRARATKEQPS
jgi:hypothetical protein